MRNLKPALAFGTNRWVVLALPLLEIGGKKNQQKHLNLQIPRTLQRRKPPPGSRSSYLKSSDCLGKSKNEPRDSGQGSSFCRIDLLDSFPPRSRRRRKFF